MRTTGLWMGALALVWAPGARQVRQGVGILLLTLITAQVSAETPVARELPLDPAKASIQSSAERDLIETDWRKQDGIGTPRMARGYREATELTLRRGDDLLADLSTDGVEVAEFAVAWQKLRGECQALGEDREATEPAWESLWRRVHLLRRRIVFANPLAPTGPLVFLKRVPSAFSHQLTQYYGRDARPGGGLFVLESPGRSFACRQLASALPTGSYLHPEVSHDGRRILFAYCRVGEVPPNRDAQGDVYYHLHAVDADGSGLRQLTDGPFDDFSPCELPNGKLMFISTRRGGFHRCGRGPCPTYTLALAEADGSNPRSVSYHETNEWDPSVMHDGRVV